LRRTPPICLSLLLCDQVTWDARLERATLFGAYHALTATVIPTVIARCAVWVELTDGHGETPLRFRITRITPDEVDGEVLLEAGFTIRFTDPRTVHSHVLSFVGIEVPHRGEYRLGISAFDQPLFERRLVVHPPGGQQP
jgi:hypothetical protein